MSRNIDFYVEKAIKRTGCTSQRKLCKMLELSPTVITTWKRGAIPTDITMMKLAKLAGIEPWQALTDLNMWRADNDDIKNVYKDILRKISGFLLIIGISTLVSTAPAQAKMQDNMLHDVRHTVYYGKSRRRYRIQPLVYVKKFVVKLYQWLMKKHMKICLITPDTLPA